MAALSRALEEAEARDTPEEAEQGEATELVESAAAELPAQDKE